jgi:hypothetical protein
MFIPLHDDTALRIIRFQLVNGALIAVNVVVLLTATLSSPPRGSPVPARGIIPAVLITGSAAAGLDLMPEQPTLALICSSMPTGFTS